MIALPFLYIFVFLVISPVAEAKVYKCLDSSGKVLYKNTPCPEDFKSETVIQKDRTGVKYSKEYYYEREEYQKEQRSKPVKTASVKKISSGERVNLNKHVAKDKVTAFLFYADWCHSCEKIRPGIENMARNSDNLILRKIDITEFESPVTDQYGIKSIPYFFIFDEGGNLAVKGSSNSALNYLNNKI